MFLSRDAYHEIGFIRSTWNKFRIVGFNPKYFVYRAKWNLLGKYPVETRVPTHVDIELSSGCNLKCTMCPHGKDDYDIEKGLMSSDLARKIIKECGKYGVTSIKFSGRGEQLLHPDFVDLAVYAKSLGVLDVMFNTNGILLTDKKIRRLVDSGIDLIIISIDGATKETYEAIRVGSDFDKLINNIEYLLAYRKESKRSKPMIRLQFVKMNENIHEFEEFQRIWRDKVDVLVGLDYSNRVGQKNRSVSRRKPIGRAYCPHPWRRLTVTSGGKTLMCCVDWDIKYDVGDSNKQSIKNIWKSKRIKYGRDCIKRLEHHKINSCKNCFAPVSYRWK